MNQMVQMVHSNSALAVLHWCQWFFSNILHVFDNSDLIANYHSYKSSYNIYISHFHRTHGSHGKFKARTVCKHLKFYIYAFSRCFYPKRRTVHSGYTFFCQYVCSLGIEPTTFALLTQCSNHWATGTPEEHQFYRDYHAFSIFMLVFAHILLFISVYIMLGEHLYRFLPHTHFPGLTNHFL